MKYQLLLGAALAAVLYLQSDFVWAANPPQPDQNKARIHDQQLLPGGPAEKSENQNGNDAKVRTADTVKVQGPAPVILQIRLVDKTAD
ncbi:hypothetical protein FCL47_09270 [Desulfopila sp. IMCC35006]|uniref:hypothetical protein n=1 Tax=Desulfopila sp. IMCC35006 TaxID=2569542 RepID=UPI0010AC0DCB|nr:hypothetical protein [Desulfopila sp. IMCC35006]TKB26593.1 hypothetical protein FCL47_09270 [Desulfopila sp. IMCC35006]